MKKESEWKKWKSLKYAFRGLAHVYTHEKNFRIECFFTFIVFLSFFILKFGTVEIILLLFLCALVLLLEIVNTMIENFLDVLKPRLSYQVQVVKDILAGMVLVSVVLSIIVGLIIYIPAFVEYFHRFVV